MKRTLVIAGLLGWVAGCTANITGPDGGTGPNASGLPGGPGGPLGAGGPGSGAGQGEAVRTDPNAAGPMPLRRLSRAEYDNTVSDLLGDTSRPARDFPPETERLAGSPFLHAGPVDSLMASRLTDAAQALAGSADLARLLPCEPSGDGSACATRFIDELGGKAFRRPVLPGERERLLSLYQRIRAAEGSTFEDGARALIEGMLQSAAFLYHWELGPQVPQQENGYIKLGPYELASRLSYFLWGSMPDAALFEAAAGGRLSTESDVREQAARLLASERARGSLSRLFSQWLGLEELAERSKDAETYPEFDDELKAAMAHELEALTLRVMLEGDGRVETLLTTTEAQVSEPLARLYDLDLGSAADDRSVTLSSSERSGLLTRAGFQALFGGPTGSNPIKRGAEIYTRILCGVVPPPPANVPPAKEASEGGTTRMRFAEHSENPCAQGCHALFDGIGFAFEHYDGIGRYRTMDNGLPVDASGSLTLDDQPVSFENGKELSQLIADSAQAKSCFAKQVASFGLARPVVAEDTVSLEAATTAYASASGGVRELIAALVASRTFRYRKPAEGESLQ